MSSLLKNNHKFLFHYFKPHLAAASCASFCSLALSLCASIIALLIGPSLRLLLDGESSSLTLEELFGPSLGSMLSSFLNTNVLTIGTLLTQVPIFLVSVALLKLLLGTSQYFLWESLSEKMSKAIRTDLHKNFLKINPSARRKKNHEAREAILSTLIGTDVKWIREYIVHFYGGLPREMLHILFIGQTLVLLSPKLFFMFFVGALPAIIVIRKLGKKLKRRAEKALEDYSDLTEWLQQRLLGVETIKHYKTESLESEKMKELSESVLKKFMRAARVKARSGPILEFIGVAAMLFVLFLAFRDIEAGLLEPTVAISFFTGLAIVGQSGATLGRYLNKNREGVAAAERVRFFLKSLDEDTKNSTSDHYQELGKNILELKNLEVYYPGNSKATLENFNLSFEKEKFYAITGPSGSGKSTLFNLILGNLIPSGGEVLSDISIKRHGMGYLPQHLDFFYGSIAENIAYPEEHIDYDKIEKCLSSVGMSDVVKALDHGPDSKIGGKGFDMSGGQRQRLHLARLLYHKYPLILIDEGTSALDPTTELLVCETLKNNLQHSTVLMITHRPAPLQFAEEHICLSRYNTDS